MLSTRHGVWLGPGRVIGTESQQGGCIPRVVWVAWNGCLYKCSPEGLRPVPSDEHQFRELAKQLCDGRLSPEMESAETQLDAKKGSFLDLMQDVPDEEDFRLD